MLLTLSATSETGSDPDTPGIPATELGYLLHKHPARVQSFGLAAGQAHVFYPEATPERCTVALMLEVDPVGLVRGRRGTAMDGFSLGQYVNDRPYAASSLLAVALARVFRTAMSGRCDHRPDLVGRRLDLAVTVPALRSRGGGDLFERLFGPLGWSVQTERFPLDPEIPRWGDSPYLGLRLAGRLPVADALNQLYVLLPVLDDAKHYWVGEGEVDKLLRAGGTWLPGHPESALITRRYLSHQRELVLTAVGRLAERDDDLPEALDNAVPGVVDDNVISTNDDASDTTDAGETDTLAAPARPPSLAEQRHAAVLAVLREVRAARVADLGCGEGGLLLQLLADPAFTEVIGVDVSPRALEIAARRLRLHRLPERQRSRISVFQSSLTYRDDRLAGLDAAVLVEVIEHLDPSRLEAAARHVFGHARPGTVVVTTPNVEYNVRFETLPAGTMRHSDHRFEWTRQQFRAWAEPVGEAYGYAVRYLPVGEDDPEVGPPTQLAVFSRREAGMSS